MMRGIGGWWRAPPEEAKPGLREGRARAPAARKTGPAGPRAGGGAGAVLLINI